MRSATVSRAGGREDNQDFIGKVKKGGIFCFVIADGLGGSQGGVIAAQTAVNTVLESFKINPEISYGTLYSCMLTAQEAVVKRKKEDPMCKSMSTTLAVLITDGKEAIWGHVGDSRIYRFFGGSVKEVTDDHSVAFAAFMAGESTYNDIRTSPDQNKLIRTMGNEEKFLPQIYEKVSVPKGTAFLMCTDGFWEYVTEEKMETALKLHDSPKNWVIDMIGELEKKAPKDNDNYSAIAVLI